MGQLVLPSWPRGPLPSVGTATPLTRQVLSGTLHRLAPHQHKEREQGSWEHPVQEGGILTISRRGTLSGVGRGVAGAHGGRARKTRRHVSPSCLLPRSQDISRMASARPPPGDRIPRWQLHAKQANSPPPGPQNRLWPLPLVLPQVPACDPGGPASLPYPRLLRRTFLYSSCPLSRAQPNPCMAWAPGPVDSCLWGEGEEAAKIPRSVQVALGCRPGGLGGRPSLSLSLPTPVPSQSPAAR